MRTFIFGNRKDSKTVIATNLQDAILKLRISELDANSLTSDKSPENIDIFEVINGNQFEIGAIKLDDVENFEYRSLFKVLDIVGITIPEKFASKTQVKEKLTKLDLREAELLKQLEDTKKRRSLIFDGLDVLSQSSSMSLLFDLLDCSIVALSDRATAEVDGEKIHIILDELCYPDFVNSQNQEVLLFQHCHSDYHKSMRFWSNGIVSIRNFEGIYKFKFPNNIKGYSEKIVVANGIIANTQAFFPETKHEVVFCTDNTSTIELPIPKVGNLTFHHRHGFNKIESVKDDIAKTGNLYLKLDELIDVDQCSVELLQSVQYSIHKSTKFLNADLQIVLHQKEIDCREALTIINKFVDKHSDPNNLAGSSIIIAKLTEMCQLNPRKFNEKKFIKILTKQYPKFMVKARKKKILKKSGKPQWTTITSN